MSAAPLALITGGKRRLGAVIAARLAQAGYSLALVSHIDKEPDAVVMDAVRAQDGECQTFMLDLSDPDNAVPLIAEVSARFDRVPDLLVNNAAMFGQDDWQTMDAATLDAHFRLNLFTPLLLTQALVKAAGVKSAGVKAAGETLQPAIVNIIDQRVINPHGDQLSYTLSKQALGASVRSMAAAFGARARVNGVAPGLVIATEDYSAAQEERLGKLMPLGALPSPWSVADAVLYLAQAKDVTGQTIFVDGGAHLKSFDRDFLYL